MRAVQHHRTGPPQVMVVEHVPDPIPGPGQLLVVMSAAGVSFVDTLIRAGAAGMPAVPLPAIPGFDVAGRVTKVGAGVDQSWTGRRVVGTTTGGAYAEMAIVEAANALPIPESIEDLVASALFVNGSTSVGIVKAGRIEPGDTVLIPAAAGGIGSLLIQLAKRAGATIIAATSTSEKGSVAVALGADRTVNYTIPGWAEELRDTVPGGVQVVLDTVGGGFSRSALGLLTPHAGRIVFCGTSGGTPTVDAMDLLRHNVTGIGYSSSRIPMAHRSALAVEAMKHASNGELRPIIGLVLPLALASEAHQAVEGRRSIGKVLLTP
ncbi:quinone oxidoreductase family protein [Streptomyces sp. NPDC002143]